MTRVDSGSAVKVLQGISGDLFLYQDRIVIRSKGMISRLSPTHTDSEYTLSLSAIRNIRLGNSQNEKTGLLYFNIFDVDNNVFILIYSQRDHACAQQIKWTIEQSFAYS